MNVIFREQFFAKRILNLDLREYFNSTFEPTKVKENK